MQSLMVAWKDDILDTKVCRVSAITALSNESMQSFMVAGKDDDCPYTARHWI